MKEVRDRLTAQIIRMQEDGVDKEHILRALAYILISYATQFVKARYGPDPKLISDHILGLLRETFTKILEQKHDTRTEETSSADTRH